MDKTQANAILSAIRTGVPGILPEGFALSGARGSYGDGDLRLTLTVISSDPAASPRVIDWRKYHKSYGLPEDALGKTIRAGGVAYTITGLIPSRRKFPVAVTRVQDNKALLLTIRTVKSALGLPVTDWD